MAYTKQDILKIMNTIGIQFIDYIEIQFRTEDEGYCKIEKFWKNGHYDIAYALDWADSRHYNDFLLLELKWSNGRIRFEQEWDQQYNVDISVWKFIEKDIQNIEDLIINKAIPYGEICIC